MCSTHLSRLRARVPARAALTFRLLAAALLSLPTNVAIAQAPASTATAPQASSTMEYTILICESDQQLASRTSPAHTDAYWAAYDVFGAEMGKAGVLPTRGGGGVATAPSQSTCE